MKNTSLYLIALAMAISGPVKAADVNAEKECAQPCLEYSGHVDLNTAWLIPTDSGVSNSYDIGPEAETEFTLRMFDGFSVLTNLKAEPVLDVDPGTNRFFSDIGAYVEVLQANVAICDLTSFGGKIHPAFGHAWDVTPGLHGTDLAEDYELKERLGGGASYAFDGFGFNNVLSASAFTADRTMFSESVFTNRGRRSLADGEAGNTDGVSSFAVALDGCAGAEVDSCYDDGKFGYQVAARYQKGGEDSEGNELGFLGSVIKSFAVGEDTTIRLLGEAAWFRDFQGGADNAIAFTGSGALEQGPFTYSLSYSQERIFADGADIIDHLVDATATYDLGEMPSVAGERWSIGAGYTYEQAEDEGTHIIGMKLSAKFDGNVSF